MTFHLNKVKNTVSRCRAKSPATCPFGGVDGTENHYGTASEANEALEKHLVEEHGGFKTFKNNGDDGIGGPVVEETVKGDRKKFEEMETLSSEWKKMRDDSKARVENDPDYKGTDAWLKEVYEARELGYQVRLKQVAYAETLDEDDAKEFWGEDSPKKKGYNKPKTELNYGYYHPEIDAGNNEKQALGTIAAFSGVSEKEILAKVDAYMGEGFNKTEAFRKVWNDLPIRTDKKMVIIDLETAGPTTDIDMGANSSIIEVGYIIRDVDGSITKKSYFNGVSDTQLAAYGTGAEEIHNISADMIAGEKHFIDDDFRQRELLEDLSGSVLVAHNAVYEKNQLSYNLRGFYKALENDEIEILDTRNVSKYFVPSAENNSNQKFVEAAGGEYVNAHRALNDVEMTWGALKALKNIE